MVPEEVKNTNQQGNSQAKNAGSNSPQRAVRKPLLDGTNLLGTALWIMGTVITSIALMLAFVKLPANCLGVRGELVNGECASQLINSQQGITVLLVSVFLQLLISAMVWRIRNVIFARIGHTTETLINFVGLYWLFCIQLGVFGSVYIQISTILKTFSVETILGYVFLISLSVGWPFLEKYCFDAPVSGPPAGVRRS